MSEIDINKVSFEGVDEITKATELSKKVDESMDDPLSPEEVLQIEKEIELEKKYGDSSGQAFLEGAASGLTLGLSDQALVKSGLTTKEALRERRKRSAAAALTGEVAGVGAGLLMTGGTSAAARGASSAIATAAKSGQIAERLSASVLKKIVAETGKNKLAKEVLRKSIAKGAGSAVEGSFYGVGHLVSENALGEADFNAENLLSSAGSGAVLGGIAGGAFGAIEVLAPIISKTTGKVTGTVNKRIKGALDPKRQAQELSGMKPSDMAKQREFRPDVFEHTPKMLNDVADSEGLKLWSSGENLLKGIKSFMKKKGDGLEDTIVSIQKAAGDGISVLPSQTQLATRITDRLGKLSKKFTDSAGNPLPNSLEDYKKIQKVVGEWDDFLISSEGVSAKELIELKRTYQKLAKWDYRHGQVPLKEKMNREISTAILEELKSTAEKAGGNLGAKLKQELLDYGTAAEFVKNYSSKVDKQANNQFFNNRDLLLGAGAMTVSAPATIALLAAKKFASSDLKRKLIILSDIEKANKKVSKKITNSVKNFSKGKKAAVPVSVKTLMDSGFSRDEKGRKPASKQDAFKNMRDSLYEFQVVDHPAYNRGNIHAAAPMTDNHLKMLLSNSVHFLLSRLPVQKTNDSFQGLFREYQPSTQELAKFERYLKAVESPLSVLDDLESGRVSPEAMEAVKSVYPNLYARIQNQVFEQVQKEPENFPYQKRLQLGLLLNVPLDISLQPENIAALQSHYSEAQESQAGGSSKISAGKAQKMDMAQSQMGSTERTATRNNT